VEGGGGIRREIHWHQDGGGEQCRCLGDGRRGGSATALPHLGQEGLVELPEIAVFTGAFGETQLFAEIIFVFCHRVLSFSKVSSAI
jgi:hypothetical protein